MLTALSEFSLRQIIFFTLIWLLFFNTCNFYRSRSMSELSGDKPSKFLSGAFFFFLLFGLGLIQILLLAYHHFQSSSSFNGLVSNKFPAIVQGDSEGGVDLNLARDRLLSTTLDNDVPEFIQGVDESISLNSLQISQFKKSAMYKQFNKEEVVRKKLDEAKKDGVFTVGEYYEIRSIINDLRLIEDTKARAIANEMDSQLAKKELMDL